MRCRGRRGAGWCAGLRAPDIPRSCQLLFVVGVRLAGEVQGVGDGGVRVGCALGSRVLNLREIHAVDLVKDVAELIEAARSGVGFRSQNLPRFSNRSARPLPPVW